MMEEEKKFRDNFISSFCDYLEQIEDENKNYKIALSALKETLNENEKTKSKISLFDIYKNAKNKTKSVAQFLDFPSNLPFETVLLFIGKKKILILI